MTRVLTSPKSAPSGILCLAKGLLSGVFFASQSAVFDSSVIFFKARMTHAHEYASQLYYIFNVDMRSQVQINLYNGEHLQIRGWTVYPLSCTCVVLYNLSHDLLLY
jgi:hypothetical protein